MHFFEEMFPSGFDGNDHEQLCSQNACFKMFFVEKSFNTTEITGLDCWYCQVLTNCSQRSQDWVGEYSEYSQCCLVYTARWTEGILLKVSYGNILTWNPSQQNRIEKDCESFKSRPIELNREEVRTQAQEPNSCNCRNRASNHFLVWLYR